MNAPEVEIDDLKKLAKDRDQQAIIAYCIQRDGTVRCVTYGEDKLKCNAAGWWGQGLLDNIISIVPFQTVFGWGTRGVPTGLTKKQLTMLGENSKIPKEFL